MSAYLPEDLAPEQIIGRARLIARQRRLSVVSNGRRIPVLHLWKGGFAVAPDMARHLRGLVELYEGEKLLGWCLVSSGTIEADAHRFDFKRFTACAENAPVDFVRILPKPPTSDIHI
ncbi:hypothetical protein SAMN04488012_11044 [Palleronia salina]|uniref:Uncharacterized protein n=2 Tax=Palleronia TaxID=315422 RepID=A0A1M6JNH1_9RHOB|nr:MULTISPECIES: hypothetical protein [Palleronia]SEM97582.1 hypothetical protein SAMN04488011_10244 [Palleronia pelagia]SHJ48295.1 hypothetical protein SAMN04488012_11044 [Palleronia salina]